MHVRAVRGYQLLRQRLRSGGERGGETTEQHRMDRREATGLARGRLGAIGASLLETC